MGVTVGDQAGDETKEGLRGSRHFFPSHAKPWKPCSHELVCSTTRQIPLLDADMNHGRD
jgi:hypothetical protein